MPLASYMDLDVPRAITLRLRPREVDVLTAHEDGANEIEDAALLDRANELGHVLFTRDKVKGWIESSTPVICGESLFYVTGE